MNISTCTRIVDDVICGSDQAVQIKNGFFVCETCRIEGTSDWLFSLDQAAVKSKTETNIYVLETPFSTLKIGAAVDVGQRLRELHCDFSAPVRLLACFEGTYLNEAELHVRFAEYRLRDRLGEQFQDVEKIRDFADETGINFAGKRGLASYAKYRPTGTAQYKPDYIPPALRDFYASEPSDTPTTSVSFGFAA